MLSGLQSPSSGNNWSLIEPRGSWVNIWIICRQQALPPLQRQQLHSWRRCEASERNCRGFRRQPAAMPAHSRQLRVPGGAPGSPSLAGVEGAARPGPWGRVRPTVTSGRLGFYLFCGDSEGPPCDEASGHGESPAASRNRCSVNITRLTRRVLLGEVVSCTFTVCCSHPTEHFHHLLPLPLSPWQPLPHSLPL